MDSCVSREHVFEFLASRLSDAEEDRLFAHMSDCQPCRLLADQLSDDEQLRRDYRDKLVAQLDLNNRSILTLREKLRQLGPSRGARAIPLTFNKETIPENGRQTSAVTERLGRFRLVEQIGAGAFATVWLAHDDILRRDIALKVPHAPALFDANLRSRFVREAQATASLHHPNIVPVYEAGEAGTVPYLAMALCSGSTLAIWLAAQDGPIPPRLAAEIVYQLAGAVEHAHQHGILHRDIKPGNVLLDPAVPNGALPFTPMLSDFGLARIDDHDQLQTADGHILGTPRYMAPEQAMGRPNAVGPRTDIYALGVLLYELLTRRHPIEGADTVDTLRRLATDIPAAPRRLRAEIPADLDAICLKCLEKSPHKRYATAPELALELQRFLSGLPTAARPIRTPERLARIVRRHPARAALFLLIVLGACVSLIALSWHTSQLERLNEDLALSSNAAQIAQRRAESSELSSRQLLYAADIKLASRAYREGDLRQAAQLLERHGTPSDNYDERGFEWHYLSRLVHGKGRTVAVSAEPIYTLDYSPDGAHVAVAGRDGQIRLFDSTTFELRAAWPANQGEINGLDHSSDGRLLASAGDDGTVRVWDVSSKQLLQTIQCHQSRAYGVRFHAGDDMLITCGDEPTIRQWDRRTGALVCALEGHARAVEAIAVLPGKQLLASVGSDRATRVWDLSAATPSRAVSLHNDRALSLAVSADGRLAADGDVSGQFQVWEAETGRILTAGAEFDAVHSVALSSDGSLVAVGDRGGAVHLMKLESLQETQGIQLATQGRWWAHSGRTYALAFSPDGKRLLSGGEDGKLRITDVLLNQELVIDVEAGSSRVDIENRIKHAVFIPQSSSLAIGHKSGTVTLWDWKSLRRMRVLHEDSDRWHGLAASPDGRLLVRGTHDGEVTIWDLSSDMHMTRWNTGVPLAVDDLFFMANGKSVALVDQAVHLEAGRRIQLLDTASRDILGMAIPERVSIAVGAPDGKSIAAAIGNGTRVLNTSGQCLHVYRGHTLTVGAIGYCPRGRLFASGGDDRQVLIFDADSEVAKFALTGHRSSIVALAFSPDGRSLVTVDETDRCLVWHVATGRELCELPPTNALCWYVLFSPDASRIAFVTKSHRLHLVDVSPAGGGQ